MIPFHEGSVRGFLHLPQPTPVRGLVLTHGAGGNCNAPMLVEVARVLEAEGIAVLRCDLPFRQRKPFGPPSPATAAQDRQGLRDAVEAMRKIVTGPVTLSGTSYGGRQATMLASEDPATCDSLLLFSYPLHAPGKPAQLRTAHFPALRTPARFVHGTKDPFGAIEELTEALTLIPAPKRLIAVEGAGHDLKKGKFEPNVWEFIKEPLDQHD